MTFIETIIREHQKGGLMAVLQDKIEKLWQHVARIPPIDYFLRQISISRLQDLQGQPGSNVVQPDKAIAQAYMYNGFGRYQRIAPGQNPSELMELYRSVEKIKPETVVEIGTAKGGTLYVWTQVFDTAEKFISINLPGQDWRKSGGYSKERAKFYKEFTKEDLNCIRQNSHNEETKEKLKQELGEKSIDFLFIDGDHSYEGVKKDFEMYRELVSDGGIIAFHDIVPHPQRSPCSVDRFWKEIKSNYETQEIIANKDQDWAGIGVLKYRK